MEKIEDLLEKLDNRIPASLGKRLDTLDDLQEKLEASGEDYEKNPTNDNRDSYNEVIEYVEKMELGIIRDLEALLEKRNGEQSAKEQKANEPATPPASTEAPITPQAKAEEKKVEKKEGVGILTLVVGGIFFVASLGALNYFRKQ